MGPQNFKLRIVQIYNRGQERRRRISVLSKEGSFFTKLDSTILPYCQHTNALSHERECRTPCAIALTCKILCCTLRCCAGSCGRRRSCCGRRRRLDTGRRPETSTASASSRRKSSTEPCPSSSRPAHQRVTRFRRLETTVVVARFWSLGTRSLDSRNLFSQRVCQRDLNTCSFE